MNTIRIWQPAELPGATLLRGDLAAHTFPRHTHDEVVVGFNVRGAHTFWCHRNTHDVPPGTLALVNPGEVHTGSVLGSQVWDYRAFYLARDWLERVASDAELPSVRDLEFPLCTVRDPQTVNELCLAHDILSMPTRDALEGETRALEALVHLVQRHGAKRAPAGAIPCRKAVVPVHDLIVREYQRVIRLDELARISGYSKYKLIAAFRAAYGQPPYELVVTLRVAEARRRIARGEPIASVAAGVGFTDQSHLTRHFKRIVGVTPGQYARAFGSRGLTP